jgi:DNA-binding transcriptional LysR family regulator
LQIDLKAGRIDAAALVRPQSGGSSRLLWQNLTKQAFVMLVPSDAPAAPPQELLQRLGWIRYDIALTGGRIAAHYVKRVFPRARCSMEVRSIDAIVAMVSAGLGASVVPRPRASLLAAHAVRQVRLGKNGPTRQISLARRSADTENRNIDAIRQAFSCVYTGRDGSGAGAVLHPRL